MEEYLDISAFGCERNCMLSHESVMPINPSHSIIVCFENRWTRYELSSVISVFVPDVLLVALKFRIVWNSGNAFSDEYYFLFVVRYILSIHTSKHTGFSARSFRSSPCLVR